MENESLELQSFSSTKSLSELVKKSIGNQSQIGALECSIFGSEVAFTRALSLYIMAACLLKALLEEPCSV